MSIVARRSWTVRRMATISRETLPDTGEIQYTVRVADRKEGRPFLENSFATLPQAESFLQRIRKESEVTSQAKISVDTEQASGPRYIVIDVTCISCGESVKPDEIEFDIFRNTGIAVHLEATKPECVFELAKRFTGDGR